MKTLGLLLVFSCCLLAGAAKAWGKREKLARERACIRLMRHGEGKIKTALCPRSRLFLDFQSPVLLRTGFLTALQQGEEPLAACQNHRAALGLDEKSFENLCDYFALLGKLEYQQQLRHCALCCQRAEQLLGEHEQKDKDAVVLHLTLGATAGAFAVILLL